MQHIIYLVLLICISKLGLCCSLKHSVRSSTASSHKFLQNDEPMPKVQSRMGCENNMCEEVDNYPSDEIDRFLNATIRLQNYFDVAPELNNRYPFDEEVEELCTTDKFTKFPKMGMNLQKKNKTIINTDFYKQGVDVYVCHREGEACKFTEYFPGFVGKCEQRYSTRRLLTYDGKEKDGKFESFAFPSCCVCTIRKKVD